MTVDVQVERIRLYRKESEGDELPGQQRSWWMIDYEGPDGETLRTRRTTFSGHADPYAVKRAVQEGAEDIPVYFDWRDHPRALASHPAI